ncbi:hypothetical protein MB46_02590 [Arthrobacter alpinus]|nr:hypothetical protein MB46_02590 [Arthrobacter alpinus]
MHELGVYGMSGKLSAYGSVPVKAVAIVAYPEFFKQAASTDYPGMLKLMRKTISRGVGTGIIMWGILIIGSIIASKTILSDYVDLVQCTILMAACVPLRAVQYGAGDVLYALDKSRMRLLVTLLGAAISATGAFVGSYLAGLIGAASGLLIAQILVASLLWWFAEKSLRIMMTLDFVAPTVESR